MCRAEWVVVRIVCVSRPMVLPTRRVHAFTRNLVIHSDEDREVVSQPHDVVYPVARAR